jgi:hypothetical protein
MKIFLNEKDAGLAASGQTSAFAISLWIHSRMAEMIDF